MSNLELLQEVAAEALDCPRCELSQTRRNVVFGEGNPSTPMMLIGEGPGEHEDATGRPFVGRAGTLLDKALHANRIARKHVYITNIIKCRASLVEGGRMKNRPPRVQEVDACNAWLMRQIEIIRPLVIVCVGGPAANLMIHKGFQMTLEHGRWFDSPYCRAITAVLHPAYVLRQEGQAYDMAFQHLVDDIGAARRKVIELKRALLPDPPSPPNPSLF